MIKTFVIQANKYKETDSQPDVRAVGKDGEEFVEIGAGWKKQDKNNKPYISVQLSKEYGDKEGYVVITEKEYNKLNANMPLDAQNQTESKLNAEDEDNSIPF